MASINDANAELEQDTAKPKGSIYDANAGLEQEPEREGLGILSLPSDIAELGARGIDWAAQKFGATPREPQPFSFQRADTASPQYTGLIPLAKEAGRAAWSGATLPGDVLAGKVDPLSEEGIRRSGEMAAIFGGGLSPAAGTGRGIARIAAQEAPEITAARQAQEAARQFGLDIHRGQAGENLDAIRYVDMARRGAFGPEAQRQATEFVERQLQQAEAATRGPEGALTPREAGETVGQEVRQAAREAREQFGRQYEEAFAYPGEFHAGTFEGIGQRIRGDLSLRDEPVIVDDLLTPAATRALHDLDNVSALRFQNRADPFGQPNAENIIAVNLRGVDQARKRLVAFYKAARRSGNDSDIRATDNIIKAFDDRLEQAISNGLFSGDERALQALRAARASYANYQRTFRPRAAGDDVGLAMRRIIDRNATPEEIANMIVGTGRIGRAGLPVRIADRLEGILSPDAWASVRRAIWNKATEPTAEFSPARAASGMLELSNSSLGRRMFSNEERAGMNGLATNLRRLVIPSGARVAPDTAPALMALQRHAPGLIASLGLSHVPLLGRLVDYLATRGMDAASLRRLTEILSPYPAPAQAPLGARMPGISRAFGPALATELNEQQAPSAIAPLRQQGGSVPAFGGGRARPANASAATAARQGYARARQAAQEARTIDLRQNGGPVEDDSRSEPQPEPSEEAAPDRAGGFEAAAARMQRRYPTREPDPASLAASQGKVTWGQFLPSEERAAAAAAALQRGEDYDPRDVFLSALGAVGAPGVGLTREAATLGAGAVRRAAAAAPEEARGALTAAERAAPLESARFPQYAEEYPAIGPGTPMPKTKPEYPGETYLAKTLTPEAEEFAAAREKIMANMKKQGYTPYYDPAERFAVDPSKYPTANVDTLTLMAKKPETINKYMEAIGALETRRLLREAYRRGQQLGNAHDWYFMGQLESDFVKELGPEAGREAFLQRFAVPMGATTSGNKPTANFIMAHYLNYLRNRGLPMPTGSHEFPAPVGSRRGMTNVRDYERIMGRGGYQALGADQPKMHNFVRSFIGDLSRGVMDENMVGGMLGEYVKRMGMSKKEADDFIGKVRNTMFGTIERPLHLEAARAGVAPGAFQDVAWAGFKNEPGKPMIQHINEAIERTHRLTGMPREEIVRRGVVRGEIPLYTPGAVPLPGLTERQQ